MSTKQASQGTRKSISLLDGAIGGVLTCAAFNLVTCQLDPVMFYNLTSLDFLYIYIFFFMIFFVA